jgi:hypothetical protein
MIRHENSLLNQRLGWLFAVQGFLFTATAFFWRESAIPVIVLGLVGMISCASIGHTLRRGQDAIKHLLINKGLKYKDRLLGVGRRRPSLAREDQPLNGCYQADCFPGY